MRKLTKKAIAQLFPQLKQDANKYTRGTCELVVGDRNFPGAGVLATMAATRMGAGYVKAYTSDETAAALRIVQPSAVIAPFKQYSVECHAQDDLHPSATVVGCGLAGTEGNMTLVKSVIAAAAVPLVLDGGALTAIATESGFAALAEHRLNGFSAILTPHGGEAARLIAALPVDAETADDLHDRARQALKIARAYDAVCVLKGPQTYIASPDDAGAKDVAVFADGTPALAKAGTGDVLAGCVGALLAQGLRPRDAAELGVVIHGEAGVLAAEKLGAFCVTTEDVLRFIPKAVKEIVK